MLSSESLYDCWYQRSQDLNLGCFFTRESTNPHGAKSCLQFDVNL